MMTNVDNDVTFHDLYAAGLAAGGDDGNDNDRRDDLTGGRHDPLSVFRASLSREGHHRHSAIAVAFCSHQAPSVRTYDEVFSPSGRSPYVRHWGSPYVDQLDHHARQE
eukprot:TRINITY_DN2602_c0_g1_i1.p2 TRINITY_DN2602_c0_g1~~TRINITY_DN2602_c0_g1_i1.p2  ORF type:complete len:108 (-),score=11.29 TRINITY_DN2602_c0_g1_i1:34-357(-)